MTTCVPDGAATVLVVTPEETMTGGWKDTHRGEVEGLFNDCGSMTSLVGIVITVWCPPLPDFEDDLMIRDEAEDVLLSLASTSQDSSPPLSI